MNPKSAKTLDPVAPAEPAAADEADIANPGKMAKIKAQQIEEQEGKYGTSDVKTFKPDENATETTWIEIELVDEADEPVPGERYEITMPDGSVASGTTDHNGWARIEGFEPGNCTITFPKLDQEAWEFIEEVGPMFPEEE